MSTIDGRRAIVTGPTSGIGKAIARQLAASGAEVVLACRDVERGRRTARDISAGTGSTHPAVMAVDTSSQTSIRQFADAFRRRYGGLDILVNNAGVLRPEREVNVDGYELTFATNVLGYYLLTSELTDVLRASAGARVINVASVYAGDVDLDDLQFERRRYDGMRAYAQSKACDRMLTRAFARRLARTGSPSTPSHRASCWRPPCTGTCPRRSGTTSSSSPAARSRKARTPRCGWRRAPTSPASPAGSTTSAPRSTASSATSTPKRSSGPCARGWSPDLVVRATHS